jgi:hypothetical protein
MRGMPMRNRVTPFGEIVAIPLRGAWLGNRGILHEGTEIVAFHKHALWITCALQHRDWRLPQWQPGHFTVLFFHDEAVALAAGHRPCALCRRADYNAYRSAWSAATGKPPPLAKDLDRTLHAQRLHAGSHRRRLHAMPWASLPTGTFVVVEEEPLLVHGDALVPWSGTGYGEPRGRPAAGDATVLTPPGSVDVLRHGYAPQIGYDRNSVTRRLAAFASGTGSNG